jgi:probable rRNA maturation factor
VIVIESKTNRISQSSLEGFARQAQRLAGAKGEISVLLTNANRMQELNLRFRGKERATDVLSFPRQEGGDIALCMEIAHDNAVHYGHSLAQEIRILLLHGMLHLAGYDHETDKGEMAAREMKLRSRLKLPATLIDRVHKNEGRSKQSNSSRIKRKPSLTRRRAR